MSSLSDRKSEQRDALPLEDGAHEARPPAARALLEAGARRFARFGYGGATISEIARDAGVNSALISYYFGGKQGLYSAILSEALDTAERELAPVRVSRQAASGRMAQFVEALTRVIEAHPHFVFMLVREQMSGGSHIEPDVMERFAEFFAVDREILEQGMAEGEWRRVDPHSAHLALIGALVFFLITSPVREEGRLPAKALPAPNWPDHRQLVLELIQCGLATSTYQDNGENR